MKYLLTLLFAFTFLSLKVIAQDSPNVSKKITKYYIEEQIGVPNWAYYFRSEESFKYDYFGNVIEETLIRFDPLSNDSIVNWTGFKYDFNDENQLVKETFRRYNWDVELWINTTFQDLFYDQKGCLKESLHQYNSINASRIRIEYISDNNCKILQEMEHHDIDSINWTSIYGEANYEYYNDDSYQRDYELKIGNNYFLKYSEHYDKYGDLLYYARYSTDGLYLSSEIFYYIEYSYDNNGLIKEKRIDGQRLNYLSGGIPGDTFLLSNRTTKYFYNCDGTIAQEQQMTYPPDNGLLIPPDSVVIDYFYEGKDKCFDYENKSFAEIYPNPTAGFIKIKSPLFGSGDTLIRVFDLVGRVLLETKNNFREEIFELDLPDPPNGGYIVQLTSGDQVVNEKIIIAK